MPVTITNHLPGMIANKGTTVDKFGRDQTGIIKYKFNAQGFRSDRDYDFEPTVAFFGCSLVFGIGVQYQDIFSSKFGQSHNYGLAGYYHDEDILSTVKQFIELGYAHIPKIVVWKNQTGHITTQHIDDLKDQKIYHFFCYNPVNASSCYKMIPQIDDDASGTHLGPRTHNLFAKMICQLLKQ